MTAVVVDDDPLVTTMIERILDRAGWCVHVAHTFEEGRTLLHLRPELLIADVRLAGFNGLHLAILARIWSPGTGVVMVSGFDDPVVRRDTAEFGATFVAKPFTPGRLREAVQGVCVPR